MEQAARDGRNPSSRDEWGCRCQWDVSHAVSAIELTLMKRLDPDRFGAVLEALAGGFRARHFFVEKVLNGPPQTSTSRRYSESNDLREMFLALRVMAQCFPVPGRLPHGCNCSSLSLLVAASVCPNGHCWQECARVVPHSSAHHQTLCLTVQLQRRIRWEPRYTLCPEQCRSQEEISSQPVPLQVFDSTAGSVGSCERHVPNQTWSEGTLCRCSHSFPRPAGLLG